MLAIITEFAYIESRSASVFSLFVLDDTPTASIALSPHASVLIVIAIIDTIAIPSYVGSPDRLVSKISDVPLKLG